MHNERDDKTNEKLKSSLGRFKRANKLVGCNDAIETYFVPAEGNYYRIVHRPPQHNDELVQSEQVFEGLAPSMSDIPETIAPNSSIEDQLEHIANWALSFNVDEVSLANMYWKGYRLRKTEKQKRNYVTRKGDVIALYHLKPEAGVIQRNPDSDGHVVLVEYEDFVLEDYRIKEFGFKPLTDYRHEAE